MKRLYKSCDNINDRARLGRLCGVVGVICNLCLAAVKFAVGLASGLVSVTADAANNLSDAFTSLVTCAGFWLAGRPADKEHPFGHARYEYLASLAVSVLIAVLGISLVFESVGKIIRPQMPTLSAVSAALLAAAVLVKLWLWWFYRKAGTKIDSAVLLAAAADSKNDVIGSLSVLAGCGISALTGLPLDGYIGFAVAGLVIYTGFTCGKEAVSLLIGKTDKQLMAALHSTIINDTRVMSCHDLLVHDYGPGCRFASCHVRLVENRDPIVCHDVIDSIEKKIQQEMGVSLVIHYDPPKNK